MRGPIKITTLFLDMLGIFTFSSSGEAVGGQVVIDSVAICETIDVYQ
jgi:hypothetical protein